MTKQSNITYNPQEKHWNVDLSPEDTETIRIFIALYNGCPESYIFLRDLAQVHTMTKKQELGFTKFYPYLLYRVYSGKYQYTKGLWNSPRDIEYYLSRFPLPQVLKQTRKWNRQEMKKRFRF